ncbi:hypothetical protein H7J86_32510 [Mycobacterium hackensackense]|uniref:hypothetical protein n=1 Tax=Mycobacterium hackensackense TaxID=228909 RepID=UPI002265E6E5|nr:hypothetical protein [Mycobacterium hackensackense]MCV7256908.1 hypothetical protein [Mycobacterium hackensackense]
MHTFNERAQFGFKDLAALVAGLVMLAGGFAAITALPDWVTQWGTVPVYLTYFLYMSIAGRLFWKGADAGWEAVKGAAAPREAASTSRM